VTEEALFHGIDAVKPGARVSDIGAAGAQHVEAHGFSVVREFVGHGIGTSLHEEPQIANYGPAGRGPRLAEGMVSPIEPMVNVGRRRCKVLVDGWTAVTRDGSLSAHFEHTVVVTRDGCEILTLLDATAASLSDVLSGSSTEVEWPTSVRRMEGRPWIEARCPSALYPGRD
jgi:methionyl aminopeptidase